MHTFWVAYAIIKTVKEEDIRKDKGDTRKTFEIEGLGKATMEHSVFSFFASN